MTYWQRVTNLLDYASIFAFGRISNFFQRYFPDNVTNIYEMIKESSYLFSNSDEFLDFPRPINHRFVYIGGIGVPESKQLKGVSST